MKLQNNSSKDALTKSTKETVFWKISEGGWEREEELQLNKTKKAGAEAATSISCV